MKGTLVSMSITVKFDSCAGICFEGDSPMVYNYTLHPKNENFGKYKNNSSQEWKYWKLSEFSFLKWNSLTMKQNRLSKEKFNSLLKPLIYTTCQFFNEIFIRNPPKTQEGVLP